MKNKITIGIYLSICLVLIFQPLLSQDSKQLKLSQANSEDSAFLDFYYPDSAVICFYKLKKEYSNTFIKINTVKSEDTINFRLLDSLIPLFKTYGVEIIFNRKDNNIFAYISAKGDFIYIPGGLVKSKYIRKEGLLIIIGHEFGHLFGAICSNNHDCYKQICNIKCKKCFNENCIAFEQQADYCATKLILPDVLPANELNGIISAGITQVIDFITLEDGYIQNGYHKDVDCRMNTLQCGYDKEPMPSCKVDYCIR